jgi:uncharacterized protein (TIRG00374 family)
MSNHQDSPTAKYLPSQTEHPRGRLNYSLLLKLILAVLLLWVLYRLELLQLAPLLVLVKTPWLLAGIVFLLWLTFPLTAWRWWQLLQTQKIQSPLFDVFKVVYASAFFGLYLPGMVGGDVVRVALGFNLSRRQMSVITMSVVVDRLLGMLGLFTVGLLACFVYLDRFLAHPQLRNLILLLGGTFSAGLLAAVVTGIFAQRLRGICQQREWPEKGFILRLAGRIIESTALYSDQPGRLVLGWGISTLVHGKEIAILAILAKTMDIGSLNLWQYAFAGAITFVVNFLPLTPGGLGVGEAAFSQLALWLEPASAPPAYATVLLAFRAIVALALLPAPLLLPGRLRRST